LLHGLCEWLPFLLCSGFLLLQVFSVFNVTISHALTFRKLRCDIVILFLKNGIFRNIPTVGTPQKSATNHAFPPWESIVCSVLSMCLLRSSALFYSTLIIGSAFGLKLLKQREQYQDRLSIAES
jgi:hypothetical protein